MSVGISFGSLTSGAKTYIASKTNAILSGIQSAFDADSKSTSSASQTSGSSLKSGPINTGTNTSTTTNEPQKKRDYLLEISDYIVKLETEYEATMANIKNSVDSLKSDRAATIQKIKDKNDEKEKAIKNTNEMLLSLATIKPPKLRGTSMEEINEFTKQKRAYNKKYTKRLTNIVPLKMINDMITKDIQKFEAELSVIDKKILEEYEAEKAAKAEKEQAEVDAKAMALAIEKTKAQAEAKAKAKAEEEALALATAPATTTETVVDKTTTGSNLTISA